MTSQTSGEDLALRCFGISPTRPQFMRLPPLPIRVSLCFGPEPHINLTEMRLPTELMPGTTGQPRSLTNFGSLVERALTNFLLLLECAHPKHFSFAWVQRRFLKCPVLEKIKNTVQLVAGFGFPFHLPSSMLIATVVLIDVAEKRVSEVVCAATCLLGFALACGVVCSPRTGDVSPDVSKASRSAEQVSSRVFATKWRGSLPHDSV